MMGLPRWLGSESLLARNTAQVLVGNTLRVGVQACYFIIVARVLGARDYGAFVGVVAIVAIVVPFASLGSGNLLIKAVAMDPAVFRMWWSRALLTTLFSGAALVVLVVGGASVILPKTISTGLVLSVAVSDLLFGRVLDISAQAYQAFERLDRTAQLQFLLSPLRLMGAVVLGTVVTTPRAQSWGVLYLASSAVAGCVAVVLASRELGTPQRTWGTAPSAWREGLYFSVSLSAQGIYNDIDKTLLVRFSSLQATGIYGAAYRWIDLAFVPVRSMLYAAYSRFFQHGARGIQATVGFAARLLRVGVAYSVVSGLGILITAPLLPVVLGSDYRETGEALRWLAVLPLLKTIHYFGADALTGAGYQAYRTLIQVIVAGVNILLCLWLLPTFSWRGAAWASLASDGLMAIGVWGIVWVIWVRVGRQSSNHELVAATGGQG